MTLSRRSKLLVDRLGVAREKKRKKRGDVVQSETESAIDFWRRDYCKTPLCALVRREAGTGVGFLEERKSFEPSGHGPDLVAETETKPPSLGREKFAHTHTHTHYTVSNLQNFSTLYTITM